METLERTRYLPLKELMLSLKKETPAPEESSIPEGDLGNEDSELPAPKKSSAPKKWAKPRARPTKKAAIKEVDVEMRDQPNPMDDIRKKEKEKETKQKGKGRKNAVNSEAVTEVEDPPETSDDQSETVATGSKRSLRRNLAGAETPSKRPRAAKRPVKSDLGGLTLEEDTAVDLELVPKLGGQVSRFAICP